ncbi:MAG: magnesium transporter [Sedimentisphaerales bacterium]|nr:magnesium transporter [Sedimentisphaerales bacterium]
MPNHHNQTKQLLEKIEELIERKDYLQLKELLNVSRSSDLAEIVEVLDEIARQILFDLLDPKEAGEVLEKIDEATRVELVEELSSEVLGGIVQTLPPDEAADVVAVLSDDQAEEVLDSIPHAESQQLELLMSYGEDTAGGIMTPKVVKVGVDDCIRDCIRAYRLADHKEHFYFVYAVETNGKLVGAIDIQTLLKFPGGTPVRKVLKDVPAIHYKADQEVIANIFRKNDLISAPVVDDNDILIGRITVDDIVDVMEEEAEEDVMKMAGTDPIEFETRSSFKAAMVRLRWLISCMVCGMTCSVIAYNFFQKQFSDPLLWASLLTFVPAIAGVGGNSGTQTSTVVVRGLATGDLAALDILNVYLRECRIAIIVAFFCSIISAIIAYVSMNLLTGTHSPYITTICLSVGLAMLMAIMFSTSIGLILPFFFKKIGIDPAISSGPLVTTTNDVISSAVYFTISLTLLHLL